MRPNFILVAVICSLGLVSCVGPQVPTDERVLELCRHIPNPEHLEDSRAFITADFYEALETMINLPDSTEVLHEWEFWFVTADGSPMAAGQTSIVDRKQIDKTHVAVTIVIEPEDTDYAAEKHQLIVQQVGSEWKLSDLDDYKSAAKKRVYHH